MTKNGFITGYIDILSHIHLGYSITKMNIRLKPKKDSSMNLKARKIQSYFVERLESFKC